jgi:hypothetical protein
MGASRRLPNKARRAATRGGCGTSQWRPRGAPFERGEHGQVAVKVIDDRGNELLVVRRLDEAAEGR